MSLSYEPGNAKNVEDVIAAGPKENLSYEESKGKRGIKPKPRDSNIIKETAANQNLIAEPRRSQRLVKK